MAFGTVPITNRRPSNVFLHTGFLEKFAFSKKRDIITYNIAQKKFAFNKRIHYLINIYRILKKVVQAILQNMRIIRVLTSFVIEGRVKYVPPWAPFD